MDFNNLISSIDPHDFRPTEGLSDELFYFVSSITPLVNVDLLVKDERRRTLLAWRDDEHSGVGWHLPGGIVRFKETLETRLEKVSKSEIGTIVKYDPEPIAINQIIRKKFDTRGHFISLLYKCYLSDTFIPNNDGVAPFDPGFLRWHTSPPDDLLSLHSIYRNYLQ